MFEWHSVLARSLKSGGRDGASGDRRLHLSEVRGWHLAQLAVFADHRGEFEEHVRTFCGAGLPVELYRGIICGDSHLIRITGLQARDVLAKGISLDLHPAVFQVGRGAQTGLHHTGVFLERVGDDSYEIYVQCSYAESIWEWLIDAALPFGYDVAV